MLFQNFVQITISGIKMRLRNFMIFLKICIADCGKLGQTFNLAAGQKTTTAQHPWAVAILKENSFGNATLVHCSGSLIHPRYVVTAAHCFDKNNPKNYYLETDKLNLTFGLSSIQHLDNPLLLKAIGVHLRTIKQVIPFPDYKYPYAYLDIAIVELSQTVPLSPTITPICLPDSEETNKDHLMRVGAVLAGFGPATDDSPTINQLRHKIEPAAVCELKYDPDANRNQKLNIEVTLPNKFQDNLLCAGDKYSQSLGTCAGDSGAPLITDRFDTKNGVDLFQLVGVLHGGVVLCDNSKFPALYARVTTPKIYQWLLATVFCKFTFRNNYEISSAAEGQLHEVAKLSRVWFW